MYLVAAFYRFLPNLNHITLPCSELNFDLPSLARLDKAELHP